ncbi:evolutionarily conserved signaling intermediate in Toll pathway, mitochondrial-like isoform X1 [Entelurus aequoreus]|uniref:evolutionarily conserved signaling intermediate in Toll pathway, mitochondrial-like isoform X1 n=1 Tax=Entelurus aequoreus TaxID=161455 RepID=UPI002B1D4D87|nr:evolutionarily conserved signaling intermediate in Toll pathway, mitochondrial-like isoform X1 [Entelurus aequoreus]
MKGANCLVQLQRLIRLLGQSGSSAAQYGALPQFGHPHVLHNTQYQMLRRFHCSPLCSKGRRVPVEFVSKGDGENQSVVLLDLFEQLAPDIKSKASFTKVVDFFTKADVRRRGHVEFIYAALKRMPEFGVEKDLAVYNKLLDVFPKEVFVPRNFIQRMFNHYPRQQECAVQILEQMENYGITPNMETKVLLVQIFGEKGHPVRKYQRIMYWFPRFKHANPFPVPHQLPGDSVDLARFSLKRIANDLDAAVTVYQIPIVTESENQTSLPLIVGIQSPNQMELLAKHNPSKPVFVEGPFRLWLRKTCVHYYILRADPTPPEEKVEEPYDPERSFGYPLQLDLSYDRDFGDLETFDVEDLDEGPVFAMCMTSQGDQATLNQWISSLQETNPILGHIPTLFRLESGPTELQAGAQKDTDQHHGDGPEAQRDKSTPEEEEEELKSSSGMTR